MIFDILYRYEIRLEREAQEYNPFGRGGGGAPMKDSSGNVMGKGSNHTNP